MKAALESENGEVAVLVASWVTALVGKGSPYDLNLLCSSLAAVGEMDTGWRMPQTIGIAVSDHIVTSPVPDIMALYV